MILLDANVMSEVMRARADRAVIDGVDRQSMMHLLVCAVTKAEIEVGIGLLPDGERKRPLLVATEEVFAEFAQHCLPFDETAASAYARHRRAHPFGKPNQHRGCADAAIGLAHGFTLAPAIRAISRESKV